jgi:hypothetical protein
MGALETVATVLSVVTTVGAVNDVVPVMVLPAALLMVVVVNVIPSVDVVNVSLFNVPVSDVISTVDIVGVCVYTYTARIDKSYHMSFSHNTTIYLYAL